MYIVTKELDAETADTWSVYFLAAGGHCLQAVFNQSLLESSV